MLLTGTGRKAGELQIGSLVEPLWKVGPQQVTVL
jgi:hypothetical protein